MKIALFAVASLIILFTLFAVMYEKNNGAAVIPVKYYDEFTEMDISSFEAELFEITNQKRIENNVNPLVWDEKLHEIAKSHSQDMSNNNFFSHVNLNGTSPFDRGNNARYECEKERDGVMYEGISENISQMGLTYQDYKSTHEEDIIDGLMDSPGHKKNMLDATDSKIGIAIAINENYLYATQNFC